MIHTDRRYLLNREVQSGDAATKFIDLPAAGIVSGILLRIECTNGSTAGEETLIDVIDRVEVIADGSDILFSLEGTELYKRNWAWLKRRPPHVLTQVNGAVQELSLLIPFGRFLGDPEANLNLGQYKRVQLSIEFSPTISATAFATGTFTITAIEYSWRPENVPAGRRGFLRTRQIRTFTSAASGDEVIELDRRHPLIDIMVYAREAAIADGVDITDLEIRESDGRVIPYTARWLDAQMENQIQLDLDAVEEGIALQADNGTIDTLLSRIMSASVVLVQDYTADAAGTGQIAIASITADRITLASIDEDFTAAAPISALNTARETIHWRARGIGIGNAVLIPLTHPGDLEHPYDAPGKDRVQLVLANGAAGAAVRVSTTELVSP